MGKIFVELSDANETELRKLVHRKGDLSFHVNKAVLQYVSRLKEEKS